MTAIISFRRIIICVLVYCLSLPYMVSAFPNPKQLSVISQAPDSVRLKAFPPSGYLQYPVPDTERDCFYQGIMDGRRVAYRVRKEKRAGDRSGGAVAATMAYGSMGGMMAYGAAATSKHLPPDFILSDINSLSLEYQQGFLEGYETQMREYSKEAAADGFIIGTLLVGLAGLMTLFYFNSNKPGS